MRTASCHRMRMEKCTRRSGRLLRRGSTHHRYLSVGRRRIGHHSDHAVRRPHRSQRDGVRDFAIVGIPSMAAVSVTAAPAMGLLIVDSMTVPVDQRYSEGMLGAFSLIARVCLIVGVYLVKGGGKTYHWVVDVRRKPTIKPPTWPTLPPPFTPAFTRRKNACKARSTRLRVATARLRCSPAHT